jgi:hypothetical protein
VAAIFGIALLVAITAALPAAAEAAAMCCAWQSERFGLGITYPVHWSVVDETSDPVRGDVVILGNDISALLIALLNDTRTPEQMAVDLVNSQKEATPDLTVLQSTESASGSVVLLLQYTLHPQTAAAMLIDEKTLLGTLRAGESTITIRGMVPDQFDVEAQFHEIEEIVNTLGVQ